MKCVYHKQSNKFRVQQRGKLFYSQEHAGFPGNRENDPWRDFGHAKDDLETALAVIYTRLPMAG